MDDLWGPVELSSWRSVPCMSGVVATEEDVKAGRAVFYFGNLDEVPAWPAETKIPALVLWRDEETGDVRPAVLIKPSRVRSNAQLEFGSLSGATELHS